MAAVVGPSPPEDLIQLLEARGANRRTLLQTKVDTLLSCLQNRELLISPHGMDVMRLVISIIKEGPSMEKHGEGFFNAMNKMFEIQDKEQDSQAKKTIEEISTALFTNACSVLQMSSLLVRRHLRSLLYAMTRDGSVKWTSYNIVAPLLVNDVSAFVPHTRLLVQLMKSFPEILSIISELYKLDPVAFEENIPILMRLYEQSPAAQLSILHILHEIAKTNYALVEPYLANLQTLSASAPSQQVAVDEIVDMVRKEKQMQPPRPSPAISPLEFDAMIEDMNGQLQFAWSDFDAVRAYLDSTGDIAIQYVRDVLKVHPLPVGIDGSGAVIRSLRLHFACGIGGDSCACSGKDGNTVSIITGDCEPWLKLGLFSLRVGITMFTNFPPDHPVAIIRSLYGAFTQDSGDFVKFMSRPFLTSSQLSGIEEELRKEKVISVLHPHEHCATMWACGACIGLSRGETLSENNKNDSDGFDLASNTARKTDPADSAAVLQLDLRGKLKKRGKILGRMLTRWYTLDNQFFSYYRHEKDSRPRFRVELSDLDSVREGDTSATKLEHSFIVHTKNRQLALGGADEGTKDQWVHAISRAILYQNQLHQQSSATKN